MVYIEVVFINNFIVDLFIIYLTIWAAKKEFKKFRSILAAVFGAAIAIAYPLIGNFKYLVAVLLSPIMVLIFFSFKTAKEYFFGLLIFTGITFALGGATMGIIYLSGLKITSSIAYGFTFLGCLFLTYFIKQMLKRRSGRRIDKVTLYLYGEKYELKGLYDTGNSLSDKTTLKPVVVLSKKLGDRFVSKSDREITVKTVGGTASLKLLTPEKIELAKGKDVSIKKDFLVAVSKENYHGYDVVLHNSFC